MENNLQGRREVKKETLLREPDVIPTLRITPDFYTENRVGFIFVGTKA